MICKNCEHNISGNYCANCGQSTYTGRLNLLTFLNEVSESVFQLNKGFFYTLRELFVRPGESLREFLDGKRKRHFKPIAYVLMLSTVYFVITKFIGQETWVDGFLSGWSNGVEADDLNEQKVNSTLSWFAENFAYTSLLLLPVFSLASYLSFYKFKVNYLEHIVINAYISGSQAVIYTLFAIVASIIDSEVMELFPPLISTAYLFWVYGRFFKGGNRILTILRSILTYILYLIFGTILLIVFMGVSEIIN